MLFRPEHIINAYPDWLSGDHWSRHLLGGRGIICGFDWQVAEDCTLDVCGGTGVSSDGTLIYTDKRHYRFTHYQPYAAPDYPLFFGGEGEQLPVWELLEGRPEGKNDARPLTPQNEEEEKNLFLDEKVMVVFLERDQEGEAPGGGQDNTDQPILYSDGPLDMSYPEWRYRIKYLLLRQSDVLRHLGLEERIEGIVNRRHADDDYVFSEAFSDADEAVYATDIYRAANPRLDWAKISLRRFGFGCLDPFDCEPEDLDRSGMPHFNGAAEPADLDKLYEQYVCIVDAATKELDREIGRLQAWLSEHFYCHSRPEWEEWLDMLCAKWEAFKALNRTQDVSQHRKELVQYFYDWCRDLINAYHELRQLVIEYRAECWPDADSHPRHLLLGLVMRSSFAPHPAALRHYFLQPPVYNGMANDRETIRLYHHRLLLMIQAFYLPRAIPNEAVNPFCRDEAEGNDDELPQMDIVKLTPGRYYDQEVGHQSIPFYYPLSEGRFSLHRFWADFRAKTLRSELHRSYHAEAVDGSYSLLPQATHPLRFNIDVDDFFRVEGHIGKEVTEVEARLLEWRKKYNLPFDVRFISLTDLTVYGGRDENDEDYYAFAPTVLGAEHLAGVRPHGTFIVVWSIRENERGEEVRVVVADFSLPYLCCGEVVSPPPPPPPPPPVEKATISGTITDCNEEVLPGANVLIQGTTTGTVADIDGRFTIELDPGEKYVFQVQMVGFTSVEREISVESDQDLGVLILFPPTVIVAGRVRLDSRPIPERTVEITNPDGTVLTAVTAENGQFELTGVDRQANELRVIINPNRTINIPLSLSDVCDRLLPPLDIDLRQQLEGGAVVSDNVVSAVLVPNSYLEARGVLANSTAAAEVTAEYRDRYRANLAAMNERLEMTLPAAATTEELNDALMGLATEDKSLNKVHGAYKRGMGVLAEERKAADPETVNNLKVAEERLTRIYLDRVALLKPEKVTKGTENILLSEAKHLEINRLTTDWAESMRGKVDKEFSDRLIRFRP